MNQIQYTIRGVPVQLDAFIRKKAQNNDTSVNQTIINDLLILYKMDPSKTGATAIDQLDWFFDDSSIGDDVMQAIADDDLSQKKIVLESYKHDY